MSVDAGDLERAWTLRMSAPGTAARLAGERLPAPEARVVLAYLAWRGGAYDQALEHLTGIEADLTPAPPVVWQARASGIRGDVLLNLGHGRQALTCFQEQLRLGQACADPEMRGLAHNDIGVLLIWDDPDGARQRYQLAYDVFEAAGPGHEAGLGLAAFNLSVAYRELGDAVRGDALLERALNVLQRTQAWPYWVGAIGQRTLRLAEQGRLDEARALSRHAEQAQPELPQDSLHTLRFFRAKMETLHGDAGEALRLLGTLDAWVETRRDMLDDYLEVRAQALDRSGQPREAYLALQAMVRAVQERHERERVTQLKALEVVYRTQEAQQAALALRERARLLEDLHREVQELSLTDDLTGVSNRRRFMGWAEQGRRDGLPLTLAFIDIDLFKRINDRCGHAGGDQVLREVAQLLRETTRPGDLVARLGGDEFVVARVDRRVAGLAEDMERLRSACAARIRQPCPANTPVTLSIGVVQVDGSVSEGMRRADQGMYHAKQNGRNRVSVLDYADPSARSG